MAVEFPTALAVRDKQVDGDAGNGQVRLTAGSDAQAVVVGVNIDNPERLAVAGATFSEAVSVAVLKAVVAPLVVVSTFVPAVPLVVSHAL